LETAGSNVMVESSDEAEAEWTAIEGMVEGGAEGKGDGSSAMESWSQSDAASTSVGAVRG
jgi:hypothetical protein